MSTLARHTFRRCRGVSWVSAWRPCLDDAGYKNVAWSENAHDSSRGFHTTHSSLSGLDLSSNGWHPWVGAVTPKDVSRVLRRVNRRIETGIVAMPETSRCLETRWDHPSVSSQKSNQKKTKQTLVFLHGFSDEAQHWAEFAELLVRGVPGGCDVVLPQAPVRPFVVGGVHRHVGAWFEPRLNHRAQNAINQSAKHTGASKVWQCGGIEPAISWMDDLLRDLESQGAEAGSVIVAGFSQGAALAIAAAARDTAWRPVLGGVLSFRGYLPKRADVTTEVSGTEEGSLEHTNTSPKTPPAVLLCQGGNDPVAPAKWARVAVEHLRRARCAMGERDSNVELTVCEDFGHELGADDVWRARWWVRERLERAGDRG